ncbi:hypothetical protein [Sodalis sp. (in: enterobacteria)]
MAAHLFIQQRHANLNGAFVDGWHFDGANLSEAPSRPFAAEVPVTEL